MRSLFCVFLSFGVGSCYSAAIQSNLTECKQEYDVNIGKLVASEGVSTVSSILRLFFNDLDLNDNNLVSASEIAIRLESAGLVENNEMSKILPQLQTWVDTGSLDGDSELNLDEFVGLVDSTIGQVSAIPRSNMMDAEFSICSFINNKMTKLMTAYKDISKCVTEMKSEQISLLSTGTKRMIVNVWKATFKTLDQNSDGLIDRNEMQDAYDFYKNSNKNVTKPLEAIMRNDSYTSTEFFSKIHDLMFGSSSDGMWGDITTINQLYGDCAVCFVFRSGRNDVINWVTKNMKCSDLFEDSLQETLGKDSSVAPGYIFALADVNKNGIVTSQEMNSLVNQARGNNKFQLSKLTNEKVMTSLVLSNMTRILPDHVVKVKVHTADDFEISSLSCQQQEAWNEFCLTTIDALHSFPTMLNNNEPTPNNVKTTPTTVIDDCYKIIKEELEKPDLHITPKLMEIFHKLQEIIPKPETTTSQTSSSTVMTPSIMQATTSSTSETQTNVTKTLQTSSVTTVANSKSDGTNVTSAPPVLADVVRDVINDLSKQNVSASGDVINNELQQLNINPGKKGNTLLTEEERQLLELLTNYDSKIHENEIPATSVVMVTKSRNMTKEEMELQELLKDVIG